jgi:hypothetical protein
MLFWPTLGHGLSDRRGECAEVAIPTAVLIADFSAYSGAQLLREHPNQKLTSDSLLNRCPRELLMVKAIDGSR